MNILKLSVVLPVALLALVASMSLFTCISAFLAGRLGIAISDGDLQGRIRGRAASEGEKGMNS